MSLTTKPILEKEERDKLAVAPSKGTRLQGKTGIITGATSGLGEAVLRAMTAQGAAIVAIGRDAVRGKKIVDSVCSDGGSARYFPADITREEDVIAAIVFCCETFGSLDIMHNNAGCFLTAELHETSNEVWFKSLQTNLTAVFWGCKHAVLQMRKQGRGGSIINTASVSAFTATADTGAYAATKAGVMGLTRATAMAYAAEGIRCNALCPGDFYSPLLDRWFADSPDPAVARRQIEDFYPTKRILSPEHVARAAVFLASEESQGMNGTSMVIDDGLLAKTY